MTQEELRAKHGTPEEFEKAVWMSYAQLFVSAEEATTAIRKYRDEWDSVPAAAGGLPPGDRDPAALYEAIRKIIDGGSESMTHEDAMAACRVAFRKGDIDAATLAIMFHRHYERLAPDHGYETRTETRKFDPDSPNGRLMIATCGAILEELAAAPPADDEEEAG